MLPYAALQSAREMNLLDAQAFVANKRGVPIGAYSYDLLATRAAYFIAERLQFKLTAKQEARAAELDREIDALEERAELTLDAIVRGDLSPRDARLRGIPTDEDDEDD